MNKKIISTLTAVSLIACTSSMCISADKSSIKVNLDGTPIDFDVEPQIINDRTMVPMRNIFEALGAQISWDDNSKTITAVKNDDIISLTIGSYELTKNDSVTAIDSPAVIADGRTLVPVRCVSEALGVDISWDENTNTVNISSEDDSDETWRENTGEINLDNMTVSGSGITVEENTVKITEGGDFTVSGTLSDGMIYVNTDSKVKLRLDNASVTNSNGPAIFFENCKKGYITVKKGTNNYLSDASNEYSEKAVLFSNDDLKLSGSGTLTVNAHYNHAIASDDEIEIDEGTYILTSANDALNANDDIIISNAAVTANSDGDGIDAGKNLTLSNSLLDITTTGIISSNNKASSSEDVSDKSSKGLKAGETLTVTSGDIKINSTDHAIHSADKIYIHGGNFEVSSSSGKGISGHGDVTINDGNINITNSTEGIESKSILTVNDGVIYVNAKDDGFNAGGGANMFGGMQRPNGGMGNPPQDMQIPSGGMGNPPQDMQIPDGSMGNPPQDMQKPNGNMSGRGYKERNNDISRKENIVSDSDNADDGEHAVIINGGSIYINASGDGLDSNGDLTINGGEIIVDGPTSGGDSALDCGDSGNSIYLNGGNIIAVGFDGMYESPDSKSSQCFVNVYLTSAASAYTEISVKDSDGNIVISHTPAKNYSCATISSPNFIKGEKYTVYVGNDAVGEFTADVGSSVGTRSNPRMGGGRGKRGGDFHKNENKVNETA